MEDCLGCKCNNNPSLAPGGTIKSYSYWILDHIINPIPLKGWLILRTKRHVEGVTELDLDEATELAKIIYSVPKVLQKLTNAEMIYVVCLTEKVKHLHFHIIPRMPGDFMKSTALFNKLKEVYADTSKAINENDCLGLIESLRKSL